MNALVVDDSAVMRRIVMGGLNRAGITEIDQASDGSEAVTLVRDNEYDLILMDWNMPVMTGIEAVRNIRAAGKTVPIIMVTTEAEKCRVIEALKAGANNYIIKPFQPWSFVSKVNQTLQRPEPAAEEQCPTAG